MSFCFAWLINELPRWVRTIAVVIFYAPSIAGNAYYIFSIIFRGDAYGYLNAILMKLGILNAPRNVFFTAVRKTSSFKIRVM